MKGAEDPPDLVPQGPESQDEAWLPSTSLLASQSQDGKAKSFISSKLDSPRAVGETLPPALAVNG